ncbi:armadillo-type protein [Umbelopsis sp. AD052]|nr:armadillo-type protein [Umbelopsis sp. AD052]
MAYSRLPVEEAATFIPKLLPGIAARPVPQRITILHMVLPALNKFKMEPADYRVARTELFKFEQNQADLKIILAFFLDIMLYNPPTQMTQELAAQRSGNAPTENTPVAVIPDGLSPHAVTEVTRDGKVTWTSSRLSDAKLGILKFLMTDTFVDGERLNHFIVGACDPNDAVVMSSEDGLRRWVANVDYENVQTIGGLYTLYLGSKAPNANAVKFARKPGTKAIKLRVVQYLTRSVLATNMAAQVADSTKLAPTAPVIVSGLLKCIETTRGARGHEAEAVRGYAYVACGLVAKKVPSVARNDASVLETFFKNLEEEPKNVCVYIQDAMSSMIDVYKSDETPADVRSKIDELVLSSVEKHNVSSIYIALKFANAIYPFSSVFARYICLLGVSATVGKLEVRDEASKGLRPFIHHDNEITQTPTSYPASVFPDFVEMIEYIHSHPPNENYGYYSKTPVVHGYPVEVYTEILKFLRTILVVEANGDNLVIDDTIEEKADDGMTESPVVRSNFAALVHDWWNQGDDSPKKQALEKYLLLIKNGLDQKVQDALLHAKASTCLLEMISLGPSSVSKAFSENMDFFKEFLASPKVETRAAFAHIFGIIGSEEDVPDSIIHSNLQELTEIAEKPITSTTSQEGLNRKHGSILCVGYLLSRCLYRGRKVDHDMMKKSVAAIVSQLHLHQNVSNMIFIIAAEQALQEIARFTELPFPRGIAQDDEDGKTVSTPKEEHAMDVDQPDLSQRKVIQKFANIVKSSQDNKLQERALLALGNIGMSLVDGGDLLEFVMKVIYDSADSKQVELAFAAGEAFSYIVSGWNSEAMIKFKDISDVSDPVIWDNEEIQRRKTILEQLFDTIFTKYITSPKAWYRKAACTWILCVVKFCKTNELVRSYFPRIHTALSGLLADRDDFTQELASNCLGLIYESGDKEMKEDLLRSLVGTFTEGRTIQAQSLTGDTVLFENGAVGNAPDGSSISTYKELCSLASDLNQPDLVYKFMNLANHNVMWASRRGAAFGFQSLMAHAEKELEPYLSKLIPRLYRYQFDPNPKVNETMKQIWKTLVKDPKKSVDQYYDQIMDDLIDGLGNRLWRVREGSCRAVTDILAGRHLYQLEPYLEVLWKMCFRALDDVKESVRQAALATCKNLSRLTVRYCDPAVVSQQDGAKVMNIVIPYLLEQGIVSNAADIQKFTLNTLLQVCKTALEPQELNYLSFHTESYNISQDQLDSARLMGTKNSPMMEGIEQCIKQIDEDVMRELSPRVLHTIRTGTGLPTKAGCARFIVSMCMTRKSAFEPVADNFLKALSGAVQDKNATIRKSWATAVGYVSQLSSQQKTIAFLKHLRKIYVEEDDDDARIVSAITLGEMCKFAPDRMKSIASEVVPVIFFGEHDTDKATAECWKTAWESLTSGTRSMVTLYMDEIIEFLHPHLNSPYWRMKQTAALTIADLCKTSGKALGAHVNKVMPIMVSTLNTRYWAGKETVLDAFVQLCLSSPAWFDGNTSPSLDEAYQIMKRESKRNNRSYKRNALSSLTLFLDKFNDRLDVYDDAFGYLEPLCNLDIEEEELDEENDRPLLLLIKANAFKALLAAFRPDIFKDQQNEILPLITMLTSGIDNLVWNVQLAVLDSLHTLVQRIPKQCWTGDMADTVIESCWVSLFNMKYSAIRTSAMKVLKETVNGLKGKKDVRNG